MANFEIPDTPEFNSEMRQLEETDPAYAPTFNALFSQLLVNDIYMKLILDNLNIKTFHMLSDLGLENESATYADIYSAMPAGSVLHFYYDRELLPNLTDGRLNGICSIYKNTNDDAPMTLNLVVDGGTVLNAVYNGATDTFSGWVQMFTENGGTLNGNLTIKKDSIPGIALRTNYGESRVYRNASDSVEDGLHLVDYGKDLTYATRTLLALSHTKSLENILSVKRNTADGDSSFNIFGEHNFVIDANSEDYDMDTIIQSGSHFRIYKTTMNTLGTPYKKGVTSLTAALILSYASSENNGIQIAFMSGGLMYSRRFASGYLQNWSTGFLPIYGGNLEGNSLGLINGKDTLYDNGAALQLIWRETVGGNVAGKLDLSDISRTGIRYISVDEDGNLNIYSIFGTHNKPSGSYTGTSAERTIDTGGTGNLLLIIASNYMGFVTPGGAIFYYSSSNGSIYRYTESDINYKNGVLTIGSGSDVASTCFNYSGYTYQYYCI